MDVYSSNTKVACTVTFLTETPSVWYYIFQYKQVIDIENEVPEQFTSAGVSFVVYHFLQNSAQMEREPAKSKNHY